MAVTSDSGRHRQCSQEAAFADKQCDQEFHVEFAMWCWLTCLVMVALWNRTDHSIFILSFVLSSSFFPRLISAAADWMSAILPHMVWPEADLGMFNMFGQTGAPTKKGPPQEDMG